MQHSRMRPHRLADTVRHYRPVWRRASLPLLVLLATMTGAWAQGQGPTPTAPPGQEQANQDPPGRVGRLSKVSGTVTFKTLGQDRWGPAVVNFPITSQQALATEQNGGAELELGTSRIVMGENTELEFATIDDQTLRAVVARGEVLLRTRQLRAGESFILTTPRAEVTIGQSGYYAIAAGEVSRPTTVTVRDGAAQVTGVSGSTLSLHVVSRQSAVMNGLPGETSFSGEVVPAQASILLTRQLANELPPPRADHIQPPPVVQRMTGIEAMDSVGEWAPDQQYGRVWYPPVERGWVPYRNGRWSFVPPWGWTWVDDAPWGFAPFHYGRWAEVNDRWAWVPTTPEADENADPVYAPALVSFVDAENAGFEDMPEAVGWVPLAPFEAYVPPYWTSFTYVHRVNITHFRDIRLPHHWNRIHDRRNFTPHHLRRGATFAPGRAMGHGQHIGQVRQPPITRVPARLHTVALPRVQPNTVAFRSPNGPCAGNGCGASPRMGSGLGAAGGLPRPQAAVHTPTPFRAAPTPTALTGAPSVGPRGTAPPLPHAGPTLPRPSGSGPHGGGPQTGGPVLGNPTHRPGGAPPGGNLGGNPGRSTHLGGAQTPPGTNPRPGQTANFPRHGGGGGGSNPSHTTPTPRSTATPPSQRSAPSHTAPPRQVQRSAPVQQTQRPSAPAPAPAPRVSAPAPRVSTPTYTRPPTTPYRR